MAIVLIGCQPKPKTTSENYRVSGNVLTPEQIEALPCTRYYTSEQADLSEADSAPGAMAVSDRLIKNAHPGWGKAKSAQFGIENWPGDRSEPHLLVWTVDYGNEHEVKLIVGSKPFHHEPIDPRKDIPPGG